MNHSIHFKLDVGTDSRPLCRDAAPGYVTSQVSEVSCTQCRELITDKWQQLDGNTFAVRIDDKTTLGQSALMYFMRRLPARKELASLRWDGDYCDADGKRWGRIRVTWRPLFIR